MRWLGHVECTGNEKLLQNSRRNARMSQTILETKNRSDYSTETGHKEREYDRSNDQLF
jgi:hypothetical protein